MKAVWPSSSPQKLVFNVMAARRDLGKTFVEVVACACDAPFARLFLLEVCIEVSAWASFAGKKKNCRFFCPSLFLAVCCTCMVSTVYCVALSGSFMLL